MTADNLDELHRMAERIGLKREWFQPHPRVQFAHYDLTPGKRAKAVLWGAMEVSLYEEARRIYAEIVREQAGLGKAKKYARKCQVCENGIVYELRTLPDYSQYADAYPCTRCSGSGYTYYFVLPRILR
jgi:hypothetical protein